MPKTIPIRSTVSIEHRLVIDTHGHRQTRSHSWHRLHCGYYFFGLVIFRFCCSWFYFEFYLCTSAYVITVWFRCFVHNKQVRIQLPTYADNVALPALARSTPLLLRARQQSVDISCSPARRVHSMQLVCCCGHILGQMDRQTDGHGTVA